MKTQRIKGIPVLLKQLSSFGEDGARMAVAITNTVAKRITAKAKAKCPTDVGTVDKVGGALRRSIGNTEATTKEPYSLIFASASYAPYVNWGTGGTVLVEPMFKAYAKEFIGKGIRKINLPARPFLTSSYIEESATYRPKLRKAIERLTKQYNNKK